MKLSIKSNSGINLIGREGEVSGYASVFNFVDSHKDKIQKGAFNNSILEHYDQGESSQLLWQHDQTQPIGYITDICEDHYGLAIKAKLLVNDLKKAKEAYILIKSGAITSLSIGFKVKNSFYNFEDDCRIITDLELWEISLVTFPANKRAIVTNVKSQLNYSLSQQIDQIINILK